MQKVQGEMQRRMAAMQAAVAQAEQSQRVWKHFNDKDFKEHSSEISIQNTVALFWRVEKNAEKYMDLKCF